MNWVGDSVLTLPAVELARKIFPKTMIGIVVQEKLKALWEDHPCIDEVIAYRKRKGPGALIEEMKLIKELRREKWDMAILFPNSFHSALTLFLAGIPLRMGYDRDQRGFLLTERLAAGKETLQKHQVEYYLDLVRNLADSEEVFPLPIIHLKEDKIRWAQEFLNENRVEERDVLIGISPGAAYGSAKRWFPERYAELIKRLSDCQVKTVLLGGAEEKSFLDCLEEECRRSVVDAIGKTDLIQLAALISKCRVLVTNDSGPMHIAAGVKTPVIALFGSSDPSQTGPLGRDHLIIKKDVPCSPCLERECDTLECFEKISVEEVLGHIRGQLKKMCRVEI